MLFTTKETLEEKIVRLLIQKEQTVKGLLRLLKEESNDYTVQAIYVVLRGLTSTESVVKRGKLYFLNEEWRTTTVTRLKQQNTTELAEGESVTYILTSLVHHDLQWKNIVLPLHEAHPNDPIFFYNYHYIWIHLSKSRSDSELAYFASFPERKNHAFSLVGSTSTHDVAVKKQSQNTFVQWAVGTEHFSKTDYVAVFSDYIITTRLSARLIEEIEECYSASSSVAILKEALQKIGIEKKKVKLIIERDREKAKKLRKKLSKEFFVLQELIKEFGLY